MLRIINNAGQVLDPAPDQKITVEKNNPLFNDADKLFQDVSYPFSAPLTENNKAFFNLGHLVEAENTSYVIEGIALMSGSSLIAKGNIRYRINKNGFDCNLEPNLVTVNYLVKSAYLTDIKTDDADYTNSNKYFPYDATQAANFEALMLDSCVNPDNHNAIWFPVKNTGYTVVLTNHETGEVTERPYYEFMNNYDRDAGRFISYHPTQEYYNQFLWANVPFYKLSYIIKNIAKFLDFQPTGSFFTDDTYKNYCLFTRHSFNGGALFPSMSIMPYLLLSDFLKTIRQRLHLAFDFNLATGELTVATFKSIKNSTDLVDITPYIANNIDQEIPVEKGYSVTLKTDESDEALQQASGEDFVYPPLFQLISGDGSTENEIECSTTKVVDSAGDGTGPIYPEVKQTMFLSSSYDENFPYDDLRTPGSENNFALRLLEFKGYNYKADGKYWPDATSVELNEDDIIYYKFLNYRKRLIIDTFFPPTVISQLNVTKKYCFRTKDSNYVEFLIEKVVYDAGSTNDLIPAKVYGFTLNTDPRNKTYIKPVTLEEQTTAPPSSFFIKAYFDPLLHGISALQLAMKFHSDSIVRDLKTVETPTNSKGIGGEVTVLPLLTYADFDIIVKSGQPKYAYHCGKRYNFILTGGFYQTTIAIISDLNFPGAIWDYIWITF